MTGIFKCLSLLLICIVLTNNSFSQDSIPKNFQIPDSVKSENELPRNFYVNQTLTGVGHGLLYMSVGVGAGYLLTANTNDGLPKAIAVTMLGIAGYGIGMPIGIHRYARRRGYKGNTFATISGMMIGGAIGSSIAQAIPQSPLSPFLISTLFVFSMPIGGVVGYNLTRKNRSGVLHEMYTDH